MADKPEFQELFSEMKENIGDLMGRHADEFMTLLTQFFDERPQSTSKAMERMGELIKQHPKAWHELRDVIFTKISVFSTFQTMFDHSPGGPFNIPASVVLVCPVDPSHYRRRLRTKGPRLKCPVHNVELVPLSEILEKPETD